MVTEKRRTGLRLIVAVLLEVFLFTACASGASKANEKIELGQKYLTELNYTEAVAAFTEVIKIDPSNIEAYAGRAEAYKGLKQYEEAKADYTTVIEKADDMPYTQAQAYAGRAEVYDLTDDTTAAESDYSAALGLLENEDVGKKENIAEKLIRELKIKVLQFHAEVCMKLGLYDKAMEDYAKLEELGVNMSEDDAPESSQQDESSAGGAYVWSYTDDEGNVTQMLLTVQAGSDQLNAAVEYPPEAEVGSMIAYYKMQKNDPELLQAQKEMQKLSEKGSKVSAQIDPNHVTEAQMKELEAISAQWEALEAKYGDAIQRYENEMEKWAGIDWKPQVIETLVLSHPVSRVEKTSDVLYIYVPTGTKLVTGQMTFTSYSGRAETIDMTDSLYGGINDPATPIYEWDTRSDANGSFRIEFREDK
ncbi:tetratricopeptide repeat protein [Faecalibacterium duncaniae]|uniref:tetratricopeptide repeat protein n=1 Tax=Faecalibacterium duncaniae (strain DSM 17677 / JCM 31915 / A2-165) TaxID=411483 RepID=UPI003EDA150C